MNSLLHALNIGTMATWMSVAGFGGVGLAVPIWHKPLTGVKQAQETSLQDIEFSEDSIEGTQGDSEDVAQDATAEPEPLEAPPELTPPPEITPLPEVPDLAPLPEAKPQPDAVAVPVKPQPKPAVAKPTNPGTKRAGATTTRATGAGVGGTGNGGVAGGKAMTASEASRVAKGNIPKPSYPSAARRAGIEGVVRIAFIIDQSGHVISATVAKSSGNSELDAAAQAAVLRGRFPAGDSVIKRIQPISFSLNK